MSGKQINTLVGTLGTDELQTYITQLQAAKQASKGVFDAATVSTYANAIQGLEAKQAALLLSTQGLTNAQIAETLAVNESNVAKNYQAMADAGLLVQRKWLTLAQVQENIQTVLGAEADTSAAMASLGLSAAIEGQEHQTVQLTAKKIRETVTTNALTQAQAQELAMRTGVILSMQGQAAGVLPKWIATVKAATIAVLGQVKATVLWIATNPVGWLTYAAAVIGGAVWAYKKFGDTVENAGKKVEDAAEKFSQATSELENIDAELSNVESKIKELESLDSMTWVEQEELNRLREVTKELELQKQIRQEAQLQTAEDLYDANKHLFEKEYRYFKLNDHDSNVRDVEEGLDTGRISIAQIDFDNIDDAIGTLRFLQKEKEKIFNTDTITEELQSQIDEYDEFMEDIRQSFSETLSSLSEYKQNILEIASIRDLTEDEQDFYAYLSSMQKAIYEYYSPATWNSLEFESVFDTEGIEKTKEELISMYKSGELSSAEMLEQFPKLNQAIQNSEIIVGEGSDAFKEFFNEIAAMADQTADIVNDALTETKVQSTITSSIEQIATQLEPQFAKLGDAYKDIFTADGFTLDAVDNSMLEDLRKSFTEIEEEIGVTFDAAQLENFFAVLSNSNSTAEQTQEAFNSIATSYLYSTDVLESLNSTTIDSIAKQLEALGVVNASEVATGALAAKEEYLAFAMREHADEAGNLISVTQDLANATADDINVLIAEQDALEGEGIALDEATQKIIAYWMQKQLANGQLSTVGDIQQLGALCEALGVSSAALRNYIYFKKLASMTDVYDAASIERFSENAEKNMAQAQADIQGIYSKLGGAEINFAVPDTSNKSGSKSKSEKDTTKEFDWIEQAIENVKKEVSSLDDVVNSAYSTFSQKNEALAKEIGKVSEEIDLQQKAYDEYMRKADSIGLSDHYKGLVQSGAINIEEIKDENLQKQIDAYQKWYDKAQNASDAIKQLKTDMKDLYVNAYELQTDNLKERLDSDSITQKQYLEGLKAAYEQFYGNLEDYAQQYHEAVLEYLDEEKGYLNDVAGAAASLLDREIDNVRDDADEQENRLKKQIDLLEDRKKPLEDELDALEDKAKREEQIFNLQKAQYALAKAEYQRPKLVNYMPDTIVI